MLPQKKKKKNDDLILGEDPVLSSHGCGLSVADLTGTVMSEHNTTPQKSDTLRGTHI